MAIDLEKLKARLADAKNKGKRDENWFKPAPGEQCIRIVPTKDGDPFKDYHFHYNMGKHGGFLCPKKNFGEECAVCDFASNLWREGKEDDKELAKTLFARQRFFSAVVERDDKGELKSEKPKLWGYSKTVYERLIGYCLNEDYGDITSVTEGNDLKLTYTKANPPAVPFAKTDLEARPRKTGLCDKMKKADCDKLLDSVPDFLSLMNRKTSQEVEVALNTWSNDGADPDSDSDKSAGVDYKESKKKPEPVSDNPVDQAFSELLDD